MVVRASCFFTTIAYLLTRIDVQIIILDIFIKFDSYLTIKQVYKNIIFCIVALIFIAIFAQSNSKI